MARFTKQYGILLEEVKKKPVPKAEPWCIDNIVPISLANVYAVEIIIVTKLGTFLTHNSSSSLL